MEKPDTNTEDCPLGEPFVDINYVATHLNIPTEKIQTWVARGLIPHFMLPEQTIMFRKTILKQWLATLEHTGANPPSFYHNPKQPATEGTRFKTIRIMNGLSREAMTQALSWTRSSATIYTYETGWNTLPPEVAATAAQKFYINPKWLKNGEHPIGQNGIAHFTMATHPMAKRHLPNLSDNVRHLLFAMISDASAFTFTEEPDKHPDIAVSASHQQGPVQIFLLRFDTNDYAVIRTNAPAIREAIEETIQAKTTLQQITIRQNVADSIPQALRGNDKTHPEQIESFLSDRGLATTELEPF